MLLQELQQLAVAALFMAQQIANVGAIEAGQKHLALQQSQPFADIGLGARVGGGGEGQPWHLRKPFSQLIELAVFGPEIVAPLRHAVGFINGEQCRSGAAKALQQITAEQPLR